MAKAGGPACPLYIGRTDTTHADKHVRNLPSTCAMAYTDTPQADSLLTVFSKPQQLSYCRLRADMRCCL